MTTPAELRALADRVESGEFNDPGIGSALIGAAIAEETNLEGMWQGRPVKVEALGYQVRVFSTLNPDETIHRFRPPNYLESLDAAASIMPESAKFWCVRRDKNGFYCVVGGEHGGVVVTSRASTECAVRVAAALRARAYMMEVEL